MTLTALPEAFCASLRENVGEVEASALLASLATQPPVSIRYNPYKVSERPEGDPVAWCRYGYYLPLRPQFTLDPLFHGGAYYVQEAASMFLEHIFRSCFGEPESPMRILDLCAAPGGKTTLLATLAGAQSTVVANEVVRSRAAILADNVRRWGIGNVAVTSNDPAQLAAYEHYFDLLVVDAPCSGEGMFRKDPAARSEWSPSNVQLCAARQRRILGDVWATLRPGGVCIYSTCTFNREEDEQNVAWMCSTFGCEGVELVVDPAWGIVQGDVCGVPTFRFFPHRTLSEGFFVAVLRKPDDRRRVKVPKPRKTPLAPMDRKQLPLLRPWVRQPQYMTFARVNDTIYGYYVEAFSAVRELAEGLTMIHSGVPMGAFFGTKFRPDAALALFHDVSREVVPAIDLPMDQAQDFLRKHDLPVSTFHEGLNLVTYHDLPLGWIKRIGTRCNNLYPKESRIAVL